ncbi:hypothetical protein N9Y92_00705 [Chlamydiales bacterium]|nr:hypothetical protein [Chlamydiales bacterium]
MLNLIKLRVGIEDINEEVRSLSDSQVIEDRELLEKIRGLAFGIFLGLHLSYKTIQLGEEYVMISNGELRPLVGKIRGITKRVLDDLTIISVKGNRIKKKTINLGIPPECLGKFKKDIKELFTYLGGDDEFIRDFVDSEKLKEGYDFV